MKILIFSDTHGDIRSLERIVAQPADIYIAAGDLSTFRKKLDKCGEVLKPLGEKLWVLPGNHETHEDTRALCQRYGFVDFHRQVRTLESIARQNALGGPGLQQHHAVQHARRIFRGRNREALCGFRWTASRFIWSSIFRRTAQSSTNMRRENTREARRCGSGSSASSPRIYSAATSTKPRE